MSAITLEIIKKKFPIGALVCDKWGDQHVIEDYNEDNWRFDPDGDAFYYPKGKSYRYISLLIHHIDSSNPSFATILEYSSTKNFFLIYFPFNL